MTPKVAVAGVLQHFRSIPAETVLPKLSILLAFAFGDHDGVFDQTAPRYAKHLAPTADVWI